MSKIKIPIIITLVSNINGVLSMIDRAFKHDKSTSIMGFDLVLLIFSLVGVFWIVYYLMSKIEKIKSELLIQKSHIETHRDDSHEITMMLTTIQNRKNDYVLACLKSGKILNEPKSWLTADESRLYRSNSERMKKILIDNDKKLSDLKE
ncbi:MAG: hypothetical protein IPM74_12565 [Crocinitomicaceae bacterium]|nr:hypothetical protein [Crocinitomicaceae bacterium]MBK8926708.1 hypothetical protein [Crocinitomicaceae bacterium]